MGHLDELWAKFKDRGLVVLAVTNEARGLVDKFVESTKAVHPIVIEGGDSLAAVGGRGFPTSYVVDPDGKIAWMGHPASLGEDVIEGLLAKVRLAPDLPKNLTAVGKAFEGRKYAEAKKGLDAALAAGGLSADETALVQKALDWIAKTGASRLESAKADLGKGNVYEAADTLESVAESFKGLEPAEKAEASLRSILADPVKKREVDAGRKFESLRDRTRSMKPKQALPLYKGFLVSWKGTKAADRAQSVVTELEKQVK